MPLQYAKTLWNGDQKRWHIVATLSSNVYEKTKETSKYKELLILKRLKKLPKQGEGSESLGILLYLRSLF